MKKPPGDRPQRGQQLPVVADPVQYREQQHGLESLRGRGKSPGHRRRGLLRQQADAVVPVGTQDFVLHGRRAEIGLGAGHHAIRAGTADLQAEPAEIGTHVEDRSLVVARGDRGYPTAPDSRGRRGKAFWPSITTS